MLFNIGDLVTRNSYKNDVVFKIIDIDNDIAILTSDYNLTYDYVIKGYDLILYA